MMDRDDWLSPAAFVARIDLAPDMPKLSIENAKSVRQFRVVEWSKPVEQMPVYPEVLDPLAGKSWANEYRFLGY